MTESEFRLADNGFREDPESDDYWWYEDGLKARMKSTFGSGDADLRPFTSPRHNQVQTSSCVAQSVVKALEIKRIMEHGIDEHIDLSVLSVYYLAREMMMPKEINRDGGTFISLGCDVLRRFGVPPEEDWPFDTSKIFMPPSWAAMRRAYTHKITSFYKIRSTGQDRADEVVRCIQAGNPVVYGTRTGSNWHRYRKGQVLGVPDSPTGRHATVLLGIENGKFVGENSWGCYDDQTEVLTGEGWRLFSELQGGEEFATLNPGTHELEYQTAQKLHVYDYEGDLHRFKKQGVDLLVTPNHRMYVTNHHQRHLPNWPIVRADSIRGDRRVCFKKDAINTSKEVATFEVAGETVVADSWLEFIGYFLSEGHTSKNSVIRTRKRTRPYARKGGWVREGTTGRFLPDPDGVSDVGICRYTETYTETYRQVGLSQAEGENADRIDLCLSNLPWQFSESNKPDKGKRKAQRCWVNTTKSLFDCLTLQGKAPDKYIPREFLRLSVRQSRILMDALMLGDGTISGSWTYYTSSRQLADDVQELALRCGYGADIGMTDRTETHNTTLPEYRVGIKRTRVRPEARHHTERVPYKGKVYCVTVPNGLVYVRRQGQAVWCGNSHWGDDGFYLMDPAVIADGGSRDFWVIQSGYEELLNEA